MTDHPEDEVRDALAHYVSVREAVDRGEATWDDFADLFTDDVVFVDVAWGRHEGIDNVRAMLRTAMKGCEDLKFPIDATAMNGDWAFVRWRQVFPGTKPDGGAWEQPAITTLRYGGDGKWRYEEDLMNMAHCMEDVAASGWMPGEGFTMPPEHPVRNFDPAPTGS